VLNSHFLFFQWLCLISQLCGRNDSLEVSDLEVQVPKRHQTVLEEDTVGVATPVDLVDLLSEALLDSLAAVVDLVE
jgi:hypothetical protein